MLERKADWAQRLAAVLQDRAHRPFIWGKNDCAIFAADVVDAMTGQDFAAMFRGRYKSKTGATKTLRANGWANLEEMVDSILPRQEGRLRRGDVVLYDGRFGAFLGVYWQGKIVGPGPERMQLWPVDNSILASWRVG